MAFSATVSFAAAALVGVVGAVTLYKSSDRGWSLLPLATFPALFAVQQALAGLLWLELPRQDTGPLRTLLVHTFIGFAEVFWPVFAPLAALIYERVQWRRWVIAAFLAVGVCLALYLLIKMIQHPYFAFIAGGHIIYRSEHDHPLGIDAPYVLTIVGPLLFSSGKAVHLVGLAMLLAFAMSYVLTHDAYISVWCFFAALASVIMYVHVSDERQGLVPRAS